MTDKPASASPSPQPPDDVAALVARLRDPEYAYVFAGSAADLLDRQARELAEAHAAAERWQRTFQAAESSLAAERRMREEADATIYEAEHNGIDDDTEAARRWSEAVARHLSKDQP